MTQIYSEQDRSLYTLRAEGHATGSVEACAAVSSILYALVGYLKNAQDAGDAEMISYHMKPGDAFVQFRGGPCVEAVFQMAVIGLGQVALAKPEQVSLEIRNSE